MAETILVVEDERLVAADLQRTLQALGYRVPVTVASGEEALVQADKHRPQLVLMDIHLKGALDGIATARLLHQRLQTPVVFLTAYGDEDHVRRAKDAHPFGYLLKPFNERELRSTIEVALHKHAAERELRAQRRWYSATLRAIGDAVLTADAQGRVSLLNAAAERLTGWAELEALGRPVGEVLRLVREQGRAPVEGLVEGVLGGGAGGEAAGPLLLLGREGAEVPVDATVSPIPSDATAAGAGGAASEGAVVVFRDVGPQRRMQQQLALNDRLIALGTLAAGVAHEINNPLSYAHHNLAFLQRELGALRGAGAAAPVPGPEVLEEWREAVGDLREGMTRIQRIVEDLRVFGRVEHSEEPEPLDVNVALERALKLTHHTLESRALVERAVGAGLPRVRGVEGRLTQVFVNLLVNAAQALPAGPRGQNRVRVASRRVGDWVEVAVRDNGPGIPEDVRRHIFEPFFTTKAVGQGSGLGLSISHGIVTRLGGRLEVESEPGRGAEFRVLLPAVDAAPAAPRPPLALVS